MSTVKTKQSIWEVLIRWPGNKGHWRGWVRAANKVAAYKKAKRSLSRSGVGGEIEQVTETEMKTLPKVYGLSL